MCAHKFPPAPTLFGCTIPIGTLVQHNRLPLPTSGITIPTLTPCIVRRLTTAGVELLSDGMVKRVYITGIKPGDSFTITNSDVCPEIRAGTIIISRGMKLFLPMIVHRCMETTELYQVLDNPRGTSPLVFGEVIRITSQGCVIRALRPVTDPDSEDEEIDPSDADINAEIPPIYREMFLTPTELRHAIPLDDECTGSVIRLLTRHVMAATFIRVGDTVDLYPTTIDAATKVNRTPGTFIVVEYSYRRNDLSGARLKIRAEDGSDQYCILFRLHQRRSLTMDWIVKRLCPHENWIRQNETSLDEGVLNNDTMWNIIASNSTQSVTRKELIHHKMFIPIEARTKYDIGETSTETWIQYRLIDTDPEDHIVPAERYSTPIQWRASK